MIKLKPCDCALYFFCMYTYLGAIVKGIRKPYPLFVSVNRIKSSIDKFSIQWAEMFSNTSYLSSKSKVFSLIF